MTRVSNVDGGVGPPLVKIQKEGVTINNIDLPQPTDMIQDFLQVSIKRKNISGRILVKPLGYRYSVTLDYPFLSKVEWGQFVALFNDFRQGYGLRFYPHEDEEHVYYDVLPAGSMAAPYLRGKYLGYSAKIELTGKDVLPYIPRETRWSFFCSAEETEYNPDEIKHFCETDEDNYNYDEISRYSSGSQIASIG